MSEYNEGGRCTSTAVMVVICSLGANGATDPTTRREYGLIFPCCGSLRLYEDENGQELRCCGCKKLLGYLAVEDTLQ